MDINARVLGVGPGPFATNAIPGAVSTTAAAISVFSYTYGIFPSGQANLSLPGTNRMNGKPFIVRVEGNVSFGAGTYTSSVQTLLHASASTGFTVFGIPATTANAVYSPAAIAVTVSSASPMVVPWTIEAMFLGSNATGAATMLGQGTLNNGTTQLIGPLGGVNLPTGVNFATEPPLQFAASIQVGGIANTYPLSPVTTYLNTFQLES